MHRIHKMVAIIRFIFVKLFFFQSDWINYLYSNANLVGKSRISLGSKNIIKEFSTISIDYFNRLQYIKIGNNNIFMNFSIIRTQGGYIEIGNDNFFGERSQIQCEGGVVVGDGCMIAANSFISSSNHDYSNPESIEYLKYEIGQKTIIGDKVWIGANSIITAGVQIGDCAIIGAGSVVTKSIAPYTMVAGVPTKVIKKYNLNKKVWEKFDEL